MLELLTVQFTETVQYNVWHQPLCLGWLAPGLYYYIIIPVSVSVVRKMNHYTTLQHGKEGGYQYNKLILL